MTKEFPNGITNPSIATPTKLETEETTFQKDLKRVFADCAIITVINTAELPGKEVFSIDVSDPEKWRSAGNEEQLLKLFGELCFIAFEPREGGDAYNLDSPEIRARAISDLAEIKESEKVFVIAENGKVVAFAGSLIRQVGEVRMAILSLIVVNPSLRGGPYSKFLSKAFLSQEKVDAYSAITHTPGAVKALIEQDKNSDNVSYFCGQKYGEWQSQGSAREQEIMRQLDKMVQNNYLDEYGDRSIGGTLGYFGIRKLGIKGVIDPIPPVEEKELKFQEGDPLGETFRKGLLEENRKNKPHTIYGIYVSFKKVT